MSDVVEYLMESEKIAPTPNESACISVRIGSSPDSVEDHTTQMEDIFAEPVQAGALKPEGRPTHTQKQKRLDGLESCKNGVARGAFHASSPIV
jgi:hypothetical protein